MGTAIHLLTLSHRCDRLQNRYALRALRRPHHHKLAVLVIVQVVVLRCLGRLLRDHALTFVTRRPHLPLHRATFDANWWLVLVYVLLSLRGHNSSVRTELLNLHHATTSARGNGCTALLRIKCKRIVKFITPGLLVTHVNLLVDVGDHGCLLRVPLWWIMSRSLMPLVLKSNRRLIFAL